MTIDNLNYYLITSWSYFVIPVNHRRVKFYMFISKSHIGVKLWKFKDLLYAIRHNHITVSFPYLQWATRVIKLYMTCKHNQMCIVVQTNILFSSSHTTIRMEPFKNIMCDSCCSRGHHFFNTKSVVVNLWMAMPLKPSNWLFSSATRHKSSTRCIPGWRLLH